MKTIATPFLNFSGYPLPGDNSRPKVNRYLTGSRATNEKRKQETVQKAPAAEAPENWDEAWFASYE